jgi:hypothetical protein
MIITDGLQILGGTFIYTPQTATVSAQLVFDLDAVNFSSVPTTGAMDATGTYPLTVNNASSTIGFSAPQTTGSASFAGGTGQYLSVPANTTFTLSNNNWTIEYWLYQTARGPYDSPFGYAATGQLFYFPTGTSQNFPYLSGTGGFGLSGSTLPPLKTWNHYALVRNGFTVTLYLNGLSVATGTCTASIGSQTTPFYVGSQASNAATITGQLTNFRVVNGRAVYTSNFTPPAGPLTVISNPATSIGGGSISFTTRGTSAAATYLTTTPITFGTSSWTIEAYVNFADTGVQNIIGTSSAPGMMFYFNGGSSVWIQNAYGQALSWVFNYAVNTWYHVAASYDGTYVNIWVNGLQVLGGRQSWASGSFATGNQIGSNSWSGGSAYGSNTLINNLRVVVGSVVYSTSATTITKPTTQLTAVANTKLLLQVTDVGNVYVDASNTTTVSNVRAAFKANSYSYGGYDTALLLLTNNSGELLTDSSNNNFTVNNSNTVTYSSLNPFPGYFYKSANTVTDNIVTGPNTTSANYSVFMAYQPQRISSGGQGRILSTNSGQDWLLGTYAPAPGSGTMYQNVYYPGSTVWLSSDAADTGWHFIWATYNYATGVANLYIAAQNVNNTTGPTAVYKTVTFAANSNRGFNQFMMWARSGPGEPGQGNIGFVKTYNSALTLADVQLLWSQYHTRFGI